MNMLRNFSHAYVVVASNILYIEHDIETEDTHKKKIVYKTIQTKLCIAKLAVIASPKCILFLLTNLLAKSVTLGSSDGHVRPAWK